MAAQSIASVEFRTFLGHDDVVVVYGHAAGRIVTTEEPWETDFIYLFTARGGKIAKLQDFFNTYVVGQAYLPGQGTRHT